MFPLGKAGVPAVCMGFPLVNASFPGLLDFVDFMIPIDFLGWRGPEKVCTFAEGDSVKIKKMILEIGKSENRKNKINIISRAFPGRRKWLGFGGGARWDKKSRNPGFSLPGGKKVKFR